MAQVTTAGSASSDNHPPIPLIDFALFLNGSPEERLSAAQSILHGFQTSGFLYLKNHSIPLSHVARTFSTSARFFQRPQEQKEGLRWTTPESNRGYVGHGREKVSILTDKHEVEKAKAQAPDLKESFEIGREGARGMPNNWPDQYDEEGKDFRDWMSRFFAECKTLHIQVMCSIAVGMGLSESYFNEYTDIGDNTLRLLHYPSVSKSIFKANKLQVRAGEHTDYGSITLLFQDSRGGLQVKTPTGIFIDAAPIPGTVVVNAGDLLARWSNDTIKSTLHRVVEPPESKGDVYPARYSVAYFCNPNFDKLIEAIEGTYGGDREERKYEGINSGEYLVQRLSATYLTLL